MPLVSNCRSCDWCPVSLVCLLVSSGAPEPAAMQGTNMRWYKDEADGHFASVCLFFSPSYCGFVVAALIKIGAL